MKVITLRKIIRSLCFLKQEEVEHLIMHTEYAGGKRNDLQTHFASKFRANVNNLDNATCLFGNGYAWIRSMFEWEQSYVDDLQRKLCDGRCEHELNYLLYFIYNIEKSELEMVDGAFGIVFDNMNRNWKWDNYGCVRTLLYVLFAMSNERLEKLIEVMEERYGHRFK